ncbi:MAG TPA: 50S ribosomal protein L11 methyltransferase [Gaiellaceae bacterium]|nr:50S ribosomal protein L11 methyltransferase [Gaiellaceae bacterium]
MTPARALRRVSVTVPPRRAEEARARMLELFPEGFEELDTPSGLELVAYTDPSGEERLWHVFGGARGADVDAGWEERWRAFHRPVRAGGLWIGPPWEEPPVGITAVVVDPGRAFGTGAHATTRLCVELVSALPRGSLLDVGCGSGVLAIAAAKLGFAPVHAVDDDPAAVEAAERNAAANGVRVAVSLLDALSAPLPAAETAVANVTLDAVRRLALRLDCRRLVTSGYLVSSAPRLVGFRPVRRVQEEGWAADLWEAASE